MNSIPTTINDTVKRARYMMSDHAMTMALHAARTDPVLYDALSASAANADWYSDDGRALASELQQLARTEK